MNLLIEVLAWIVGLFLLWMVFSTLKTMFEVRQAYKTKDQWWPKIEEGPNGVTFIDLKNLTRAQTEVYFAEVKYQS